MHFARKTNTFAFFLLSVSVRTNLKVIESLEAHTMETQAHVVH